MIWAILSTIMCCWPCGIPAIIFANKVDSLWNAGRYDEAEAAAKNAKMWTFISAGAGFVVIFLTFIITFLTALIG